MRQREQEAAIQLLKNLADEIELLTGTITVTVSNGQAVKTEVLQQSRTCCIHRSEGRWETTQHETPPNLDRAPNLVTGQLEQVVVDLVGRFGYVAAQVEQGTPINLLTFSQRCSPKEVGQPPAQTAQAV